MKAARLTVAEIFRAHAKDFLKELNTRLPQYIIFALVCLERCRTALLGGKRYQCQHCGHESLVWNSCRHRACPQCENHTSARWMEARAKDLLPLQYFHVIFTLPHIFNDLVLKNKELCHSLFFTAVRKTLLTVGKNNLKAQIGFFCILHTWGQALTLHNHIHCVIPAGGIALDGKSWVHFGKRKRYFASGFVLGAIFRGIFIRALKKAHRQGKLNYHGNFEAFLDQACLKKWIVHCQQPFSNPTNVLKYLARYVRKVAISNSRLVELKDDKVTFTITDYANASTKKTIRIRAVEFIRRFLMHIPPPRFVRIRHCGFLANSVRKKNVALCLQFLAAQSVDYVKQYKDNSPFGKCTKCMIGSLILIAIVTPLNETLQDSS